MIAFDTVHYRHLCVFLFVDFFSVNAFFTCFTETEDANKIEEKQASETGESEEKRDKTKDELEKESTQAKEDEKKTSSKSKEVEAVTSKTKLPTVSNNNN